RKGSYHIHSDLVHLEFIDDDGNHVENGKPGHVVVTKLYGRGTPIIRYTGMNDILISLPKKCSCGINTPIIEKIAGRRADAIILPNGKILPPLSITGIPGKVMKKLGTDKIQQFQIIQENYNKIRFLLVIDDDLRNVGPSVERICREIKKEGEKRIGDNVVVEVLEVDEVRREGNLPPPVIISKVKHDE
ncbi:MAG: hypothetical protein DRN29_10140, partial [Thermoplasmata archaeon]